MDNPAAQVHRVGIASAGELHEVQDQLSTEVPIALVYNGISHVVLMATPVDLTQLALGFSFSEGIIESVQQIYAIEVDSDPHGMVVNIEITTAAFQKLKQRRRQLSGRTGCGLCGIESLAAVNPVLPIITDRTIITLSSLRQALAAFKAHQPLRQQTGSVHGVAWVNLSGGIEQVYEDVGRHNALDKLLGWGLQQQICWRDGFVLISSRASFEMVVKAARAGIGCLVAISAPTTFAVKLAEQAGMTLIGFAQQQRQVIYSHPQFLQF